MHCHLLRQAITPMSIGESKRPMLMIQLKPSRTVIGTKHGQHASMMTVPTVESMQMETNAMFRQRAKVGCFRSSEYQ